MPNFSELFEGRSGKLILPILRPGRGKQSDHIAGLLKRLITKLRNKWKHTQIIVRGDSHFCSHDFMDWATYVILHSFQTDMLVGTELESSTITTMREKLLLSAVSIDEKKTCIRLRFSQKAPMMPENSRVFRDLESSA